MICAPLGEEASAVSVNLDEKRGLIAEQTPLLAGVDGSAELSGRQGNAHRGMLAGRRQQARAGLAWPGGQEVVNQGDSVLALFVSPRRAGRRRSGCGGRWWCGHGWEPGAVH
jgi:hypothetical protein